MAKKQKDFVGKISHYDDEMKLFKDEISNEITTISK